MQVQVLLPVLFTRVSEVFITSEILIFYHFSYTKDTTMQAYKDLVKALPGLKEDMPRAFYMLAELFDYGSFDICRSDDKYIIPYIMNDAVECYLTVENAVLKGDYHSEEEIISASLVLGSEKVMDSFCTSRTMWSHSGLIICMCMRHALNTMK